MEVFNHAHGVSIKKLIAVDNSRRGGESGLKRLIDSACLGAGHRSAERFDPPKCHPETRSAVISDIMTWVDSENMKERIMWLSGPAGAGKSSICQTVAERCHKEKKLVSSFFFSRTAARTGRNDGKRLIPTIAYHLAIAIPETKDTIVTELERDPAILQYSMEEQMKILIVNPLTLLQTPDTSHTPGLVIIDGLDECKGPEVQSMIVTVILETLIQSSAVHLRFLIASRPERGIRKVFNSPRIDDICARLTLDEHYNPGKDIEVYLRSEFNVIKRSHAVLAADLCDDSTWPLQRDITLLVRKSSGQFIYASTVIRFISDDHHDPRERLQTIVNLSASEESPYVQLDAIYSHIISAAAEAIGYNGIIPIFQVLLYLTEDILKRAPEMAALLGITAVNLQLRLVDLHSVIFIPPNSTNAMRFFHASFGDFLCDPSRSRDFYINERKAEVAFGHYCLARVSDSILSKTENPQKVSNDYSQVKLYAKTRYFYHLQRGNFDDELLDELSRQNIQLLMYNMLSRLRQNRINTILAHVFKFDLAADGKTVIIAPIFQKRGAIFDRIFTGVDTFLLEKKSSWIFDFDTHSGRDMDSVDSIVCISIARFQNPDAKFHGQCQLWMATILESPERGKHLFLSSERSQDLFYYVCRKRIVSEETNLTYISTSDELGLMELPIVLVYLLKRIKPSTSFGIFLRERLPSLNKILIAIDHFLSKEPNDWRTEDMESGVALTKKHVLHSIGDLRRSIEEYLLKCAPLNKLARFRRCLLRFIQLLYIRRALGKVQERNVIVRR